MNVFSLSVYCVLKLWKCSWHCRAFLRKSWALRVSPAFSSQSVAVVVYVLLFLCSLGVFFRRPVCKGARFFFRSPVSFWVCLLPCSVRAQMRSFCLHTEVELLPWTAQTSEYIFLCLGIHSSVSSIWHEVLRQQTLGPKLGKKHFDLLALIILRCTDGKIRPAYIFHD